MLRRSICCQHNKLVFSKATWYNIALKAVLPDKTCVARAIQFQRSQCIATMAAAALDDVHQDMTTETQQLPSLEPLLKTKVPGDIITVKGKSTMSHFKRCSGHKVRKAGQQCTRLVKIDIEQAEDKVYCYNHRLKPQNDKHPAALNKKVALSKQPINHAKRKKMVKQPVARLTTKELEQLVERIHNHAYSKEIQIEREPSAIIKKAKSRKQRVDHAKKKATVEQPAQMDLQQLEDTPVFHDPDLTRQNEEDALPTLEKMTLHEHHTDVAKEMVKESDIIHDCWQRK